MNFTVDRDLLIDVLTGIQGVAERRHTMPVLSHALMTIGGGILTVVSSDLEIVVRCQQPVAAGEPGSIALPARKLLDIAKVLPKESPVTVAGKEGNYVEISSGRSHFRLAGLPAQEFPEMPEKPAGKAVSIDGSVFRKLSERVVPFASSDETRYNLAGILLEQAGKKDGSMLRMVATDGHRLAMADGEVGNIGDLLASRKILVPKKGILEIRKLAETGPGSIDLSASEKFLFAAKGDTEVWVRLLDADFPDYLQVIPKENLLTAIVGRDDFAEVLRRVAVMAPDKVHSVRLSFSGKQLEVSSTSPDQGEARDLLEAEYEGPPMKIGFNGRYLQDAVAGVSEEKVILQLKDDVSQVIIRPEKETSFLAIVMPMRIY
ncbi:MAG TPA: DNA polymerase III subunit beta [Deltaproteobacteria bacterium]|nr:DNA polymerase III subunit beta [Deltaproteobacteria bacterium]HBG72779.1 DNA polymerase III subunit beta [Deltaproteobacteria bacterium]